MRVKYWLLVPVIASAVLFSQVKEDITYKELQAAKELYESGSVEKAKSLIEMLRSDKDKKLAEQAWYLRFKLFKDIFVPVIYKTETETGKISHYISGSSDDFTKFKKKYSKSKFIPGIEKILDESGKYFTETVNNYKDNAVFSFADSCVIEYKNDSTFAVSFEKSFADSQSHTIKISFEGKLTKYEPYGDMKDEWGSTGLLLDTDGNISIELDGVKLRVMKSPVAVMQYPEYVLRKVIEYGFSQEKTFVREDNVEQSTQFASNLNDKYIISNFDLKLLFGQMNDLVPYYSDTTDRVFPDKFKSKAYLNLKVISR
ncbi:MAG: hypothetical protein KKD38_07260 [Candidatus Delongbacteria bacterium]|nr:hypothetical protein [Candidatus Delongbacteria bacterium]MCG2761065.1 hypothetical protein [Candidatus Delongbacteria bacterium]